LLLLIPLQMIKSFIKDRENRKRATVNEISSKWGGIQTLTGPVLSIPYNHYFRDKDDKLIKVIKYAFFLPEDLLVTGKITPEIRYRGIYKVIVYNANLQISGFFESPDFNEWEIADENILWNRAGISVGINDLKGIENYLELKWNKDNIPFEPGVKNTVLFDSGVSVPVKISRVKKGDKGSRNYRYSFDLELNGSHSLNFIPLGKETEVKLESNWSNPSFYGNFLPDKRSVTDDGFTAEWRVLHFNRNYPQKWLSKKQDLMGSSFGVKLLLAVDKYRKTMRTIKYGILFILLTFLIFFFVEILNRKNIHPFQYILVGLTLTIFYSFLLALSEYMSFNLSYLLAGSVIIGLITAYSVYIYKNLILTGATGAFLFILYLFIFIILQLQDYAFLLGNIGLIIVVGVVMFISRNIN
ncbi:MAG: cell envelope integrity protein CreD, partial [Actinomycetia bacterium]|nr:cell envelope integrity protein CreD [Actinomycetes bacterium]